jgi:quercetin dioxygenase-like cupin family protein
MTDAWLLVHSPLVGPATLAPLGAALAADGDVVALADLGGIGDVPPPGWRFAVERAAAAAEVTPGSVNAVVVAHSAAGALAPAVAEAVGAEALVLVDAVVPPPRGEHVPGGRFRSFLDTLPLTDGRLPPWHEWFPAELEQLLPDPEQRAVVLAEVPRLPLERVLEAVPVPDGWASVPAAYLQLSPAYDDAAAEALQRGWPLGRLHGNHLSTATDSTAVASAVRRLAHLARRSGRLDTDPPPAVGERFRPLAGMHATVVEEIVSSAEPDPVEYVQSHDEWVVVLEGSAELELAGDRLLLEAGRWVTIPAGLPHRVRRTASGTRWLAVHVHPPS